MNDFDLIIFDCDGTLTDSEYVNNRALLDVLEEEGFTGYTMEHAYKNWVGNTLSGIALSIQMETGRLVPPDLINRCMIRCAELQAKHLQPVPGAIDMVRKTKEKYPICVATNGERANVLNALAQTGFMKFFDEKQIFSKTQVKNPKPAPDIFLLAANQFDADPARCLVIEDSTAGARGGLAAGMSVWGFTGVAHDPETQARHMAEIGVKKVYPDFIHMASDLGV